VRTISWEQYEQYSRCPQWYAWNYETQKEVGTSYKDTQHLIRGHASQALIDKWASSGLWQEGSQKVIDDFLKEETPKAVINNWVEEQHLGRPGASTFEIAEEVRKNLSQVIPLLRQHILTTTEGDVEDVLVQQRIVEEIEGLGVELEAITDLLVISNDEGREIRTIYEGKATRKPGFTSEEQVRWQAELLDQRYLLSPHTKNHYYVFFHTGEIRRIPFWEPKEQKRTKSQEEWILLRDSRLKRLIAGDLTAIPVRLNCRICPFERVCPDRYVPKRRAKYEENPLPLPEKGKRTNIL